METAIGLPYSARFDISTLGAVRCEIERRLRSCGLSSERLDDFVLAVYEILTNAVRHGGGEGAVEMSQIGADVHCVVSDEGPGIPPGIDHRVRPDPTAERGRGLWLASVLCAEVKLTTSAVGTQVALVAK